MFLPIHTIYCKKAYQNQWSALSRRNHTNLHKPNKLIFKRLFFNNLKRSEGFLALGDFFIF